MRDILDLISDIINEDLLDESSGGLARRWIEVQSGMEIPFEHTITKDIYTMADVIILPQDPELKYEDVKLPKPVMQNGKMSSTVLGTTLLDKDIQKTIDSIPAPIETKEFGLKGARAAIIVVMKDPEGNNHVYVKKVLKKRSLGPNAVFWQTTEFAKQTNLWAQTKQMKKAAIPIEPTDFIDPGKQYSINSLIKIVTSKALSNTIIPEEIKNGLPLLLNNIMSGSITPIKGLSEYQPAIEIKLSELAVPLALKSGNFVTGDYENVNKNLLAPMGASWGKATAVSFPPKAEKLIDTSLHFGDEKIDISVKDSKGGGRPSTSVIVKTLEEGDFSPRFKKKYANEIAALEILDKESGIEAPLKLASEVYGVLNSTDLAFLEKIYGNGAKKAKLTPGWEKLMPQVAYMPDKTHPEYQLGYHLLAVAAKYVSARINEDVDKITSFFKEILSKSSLVQVYAKTTVKGDGLYYSNFKVTWPPVFEGTIEVDADSYTARTRPSRKISFSFNASKAPKALAPAASIPVIDKKTKAATKSIATGKSRTTITPLGSKSREKKSKEVSKPRARR